METKKLYEIMETFQRCYHDFWGYINSSPMVYFRATTIGKNMQTGAQVKGTQQFDSFDNIYVKEEDKFKKIALKDLLEIKTDKLYTSPKSPYTYNSYQPISDYNAIEVKPTEFSISVGDDVFRVGTLKDFRDTLTQDVYLLPREYVEKTLYNYQVKEGDYVISMSEKRRKQQTFLVKDVYHQPNENNFLCKLYSKYDGYEFDAGCGWGIWQLPYKEYPNPLNELLQLNEEIREKELNPLWEMGSYTMYAGAHGHSSNHAVPSGNLYWQKMEEAARYTVLVYKYYPNNDVEKKLYLLEEIEVDRNKCWLTINNLYGNNYIIRIKAENRSGGIIAVSRGIKIKWANTTNEQKPEFWK